MTRDQLIHIIRKAKCPMLVGLAYHTMTKEQVISHLERSCCAVLKELCEKK